jgi:plasmid stabilization system protein ParE
MSYSILWSPQANHTYQQILEYLQERWTEREIKNFIDRTETVLSFISQNPYLYRYSKQNDSYKCVVTEQTSLIYQINQDKIELLTFWDNRQDPKKLKE